MSFNPIQSFKKLCKLTVKNLNVLGRVTFINVPLCNHSLIMCMGFKGQKCGLRAGILHHKNLELIKLYQILCK